MNAAQTKEDCLDQIEYELVGNTSELAEKCRKRLEELRNELKKSSKTLDTEMNWKIATLMSAVEMLSKGFTPSLEWENKRSPVLSISVSNQVKSDMHTTNNGATISSQTIEQLIDEAIKKLEETKEKDIDESRKTIDIIESSFKAYNYSSQEFDLKLAEVQYMLMGKYLQNGREKEAAEYAQKFKTDMAIYIKQRMLKKIEEASLNASPENFAVISNCLAKDGIDVTDIKLWKTMTEIETGKEIELVEEVQKTKLEKPKKEKTKIDREDKKKYDVVVIRYDEDAPGGINEKDLKELNKKLEKSRVSNKRKPIKVIFEEGITDISSCNFKECKKLEEVDLSRTQITQIPKSCFSYSGIKRISLPETLQEIGISAFSHTKILEEVDLSRTQIRKIPHRCFAYSGIKRISFPSTLEVIEGNDYIDYGEHNEFTKCVPAAFEYTRKLEEVDLSKTQIKEDSLSGFTESGIKKMILPSRLKDVKNISYDGYHKVEIVICDDKINPDEKKEPEKSKPEKKPKKEKTKVDREEKKKYDVVVIRYDEDAPGGINEKDLKKLNRKLKRKLEIAQKPIKVIFEEGITAISSCNFKECKKLEEVDLSRTQIRKIPDECFKESGIKRISLPDTLKEIGEAAFYYTENLGEIDLSKMQITRIPDKCFSVSGIKKISLPDTLTEIGESAFNSTENLGEIDLSKTQLTRIHSNCFAFSEIRKISLPDTLKEIGKGAFCDTKILEEIDFSKTQITRLPDFCFSGSMIRSISLPDSLKEIGTHCFYRTKNLTEIDLKNTKVTEIPYCCFQHSDLKRISLPETLQGIGMYSISFNAYLKEIDFSNTQITRISEKSFYSSGIKKIILPNGFYSEVAQHFGIPNLEVIICDDKTSSDEKAEDNNSAKEQQITTPREQTVNSKSQNQEPKKSSSDQSDDFGEF